MSGVAPVAIRNIGLVSSVGLSTPAACAAIRAKLTNPVETRFIDQGGKWIQAHEVPLEKSWRGLERLARMAAMAIEECLADVPPEEWSQIPVLLCVAEQDRPGRIENLDTQLTTELEQLVNVRFGAGSAVVPHGRTAVAVALKHARELIVSSRASRALIVTSDSLLCWETLQHYLQADRLLTKRNANGFMPGEGAGALLVDTPSGAVELLCTGLGFAMEAAHINSEEPLRGDGLTGAIKGALAEADRAMHDMDYRITDVSGEQYYFLEASLALARTLRQRKPRFDIWHPAESTGEAGALAGAAIIALADAASRKGFSLGNNILAHMSNDSGHRAAMTLQFGAV